MQMFNVILAIVGTCVCVWLLIKKHETKTVLMCVGFALALLSLQPIMALKAFSSSMTNPALIKAICASMGFAYVMKVTECDKNLVALLTAPLKNLGIFLVPLSFAITFFISIAIPSAAGCSAAVGSTLIPLLMASGIHPATAAACVLMGTMGGILSPGVSHTALISKISGEQIPAIVAAQAPNALSAGAITLVGLSIGAFVFKDYKKNYSFLSEQSSQKLEKISFMKAIMPLMPLVILLLAQVPSLQALSEQIKQISVAEAMLLGVFITLVATRTSPSVVFKDFFAGMGHSYANIIGIIIAASVFVAGLKACGVIDILIEWLKHEQHFVRVGGTVIPFLIAALTGSGDAAAMAFNQAVTIHAAELGFDQVALGNAVAMSAVMGRYLSPILGACIIVSAIAKISPIEIVKRTAASSIISVLIIAFVLL